MNETADAAAKPPAWQPLSSRQRRVIGVLIEKAKTTDAYPMTLNAIRTGCNQKSNRSPQMDLSAEQVEETLDELRTLHAVAEVQGDGRVPKYRHLMYEWLGVDKYELAVMAELLLRGEQTVGELRGRASRMEAISDVSALRPVLRSLMDKKLLISLTPEGRGQIVTHALYKDRERDALTSRFAGQQFVSDESSEEEDDAPPPTSAVHAPRPSFAAASVAPSTTAPIAAPPRPQAAAAPPADFVEREDYEALQAEVVDLRQQLADLTTRLEKIEALLE